MTAPQSGQDPTGHGARDSAVATLPEKSVMKFEGGTLALLLFGVFISGLALFAGTIPFAGLALTGYALYLASKKDDGAQNAGYHPAQMNQGASAPQMQRRQTDTTFQPHQGFATALNRYSPSRQNGYHRLMDILNTRGVAGVPLDEAVARLDRFFMKPGFARHVLTHPNVIALLGPSAPVTVGVAGAAVAAQHVAQVQPQPPSQKQQDWWQKGEATKPQAAAPTPTSSTAQSVEASTGAFWSSEPSASAESSPEPAASPDDFMIGASGGDVCGAVGCNRAVTDFDYRCFTCRKRFCISHRGTGVDCDACAST